MDTKRKQWTQGHADAQGRRAALDGLPYSANPYDRDAQPEHFLAWSKGHNSTRVTRAMERAK